MLVYMLCRVKLFFFFAKLTSVVWNLITYLIVVSRIQQDCILEDIS